MRPYVFAVSLAAVVSAAQDKSVSLQPHLTIKLYSFLPWPVTNILPGASSPCP